MTKCPVLGTAGEVVRERGFGKCLSSFTEYLLLFSHSSVEEDASNYLQHPCPFNSVIFSALILLFQGS